MNLASLPPVQFINGPSIGLDLGVVAKGDTLTLPAALIGTPPLLDFMGFNALSFVMSLGFPGAGNTMTVKLVTIDPATGAALASGLGDYTLMAPTADGDYATSLYLPTYYATLSGLVLPFMYHQLTFAHTGASAGDAVITALRLWLSNA